jgi:LacI family transcriptional regulator
VREDIRDRVQAAIDELGFLRNATAQALRTGVSPLVGVALLDITNPFYMVAASGMENRLNRDGCVMALSSTRSDARRESQLLRTLAAQGVRGIVLTPTDAALEVAHELVERDIPVVLFDSTATPPDMSSISVDDEAGASLAIRHLLELGHRRILFLNGPEHLPQSVDRRRGAENAVATVSIADASIELSMQYLPFTAEAARSVMRQLLTDIGIITPNGHATKRSNAGRLPAELPTAIFCANDLIAFGAATVLTEAGIRVPDEISMIGFDDIAMASEMSVPLTTIRQPMEKLGWDAAEMLLSQPARIRHRKVRPTLVVRSSTAAPRG